MRFGGRSISESRKIFSIQCRHFEWHSGYCQLRPLPYFLNLARLQFMLTLQDLNHLHGDDETRTLAIAAYQSSGLRHQALFYENNPACTTRSTFGSTSGVLQSVPRVRFQ